MWCAARTLSWPTWLRRPPRRPNGCWPTRSRRCGRPGRRRPIWPQQAARTPQRGAAVAGSPGRSTISPSYWRRPAGSRRRPGSGLPASPLTARPAGSVCTTLTPARSPKAGSGKPVEFGHKAQVCDNDDGIVLDHDVQPGNPADAPRLRPAVERSRNAPGGHRRRWPPTAVTANKPSTMPCTTSASKRS